MTDCLVIFAAGKSSRFGGFPKAFCRLDRMRNIENTIDMAEKHFKKIYLIVNQETYASGIANGLNHVEVIRIVTGQGDADSILKTLRLLQGRLESDVITACWGDAVFLSDEPFREMEAGMSAWERNSPALVGCSVDEKPYAWFDVDGRQIVCSHFKKNEPEFCGRGLHDQSIFIFHVGILISYLGRYKRSLGLDIYGEDSYDAARGEMGLLDSFTWFYAQTGMQAAEYCMLTKNRVMGFNTFEELSVIVRSLRDFRNRGIQKC